MSWLNDIWLRWLFPSLYLYRITEAISINFFFIHYWIWNTFKDFMICSWFQVGCVVVFPGTYSHIGGFSSVHHDLMIFDYKGWWVFIYLPLLIQNYRNKEVRSFNFNKHFFLLSKNHTQKKQTFIPCTKKYKSPMGP